MSKRVTKKEDRIIKDFKKGSRKFKKQRFNKARSVYKQLANTPVNTPKLLGIEDKQLVIERLGKEEVRKQDYQEEVVDQLLLFQFSKVTPRSGWGLRIADNLWLRTAFDTIASINKIGFSKTIQCLKLLASYYVTSQNLSERILVHNDLNEGNIVKQQEETYFLDFESATTTKKWLLKDPIHYCFDLEKLKLRASFLNIYLHRLKKMRPTLYERVNTVKEMQLALLKYVIRKIRKTGSKKHFLFLKTILDTKQLVLFLEEQGVKTLS